MGNMQAAAYAELVEDGTTGLAMALTAHLQSNHYPPVPTSMVPVCIDAIEACSEYDWEAEIDLPDGVTFRGATTAPAFEVVEAHHLHAFITEDCE